MLTRGVLTQVEHNIQDRGSIFVIQFLIGMYRCTLDIDLECNIYLCLIKKFYLIDQVQLTNVVFHAVWLEHVVNHPLFFIFTGQFNKCV